MPHIIIDSFSLCLPQDHPCDLFSQKPISVTSGFFFLSCYFDVLKCCKILQFQSKECSNVHITFPSDTFQMASSLKDIGINRKIHVLYFECTVLIIIFSCCFQNSCGKKGHCFRRASLCVAQNAWKTRSYRSAGFCDICKCSLWYHDRLCHHTEQLKYKTAW